MSLIKRLEAECDKPGCNMVLELDPSSSQPFRDLTENGWSNSAGLERVLTFCPEHSSWSAP